MKVSLFLTGMLFLAGCATIVNDPYIPLAFSFSDGSSGQCNFRNKRGAWTAEIPATNVMIRRSDDALTYDCTTANGVEVSGLIKSEVEGEKMAASVIFWDLGITDAITDKHRTYQGNIVIPVTGTASEVEPNPQSTSEHQPVPAPEPAPEQESETEGSDPI